MKNKNKIAFFGTSDFAEIILQKLIASSYKPDLIVTAPDKPVGRKQEFIPPSVKVLAEKQGIPVLQPEKLDTNFTNNLKPSTYNLFIVASYGKIIPKSILDIPKYGTLNIHPSLLPKYRGPSPIQSAILNGDKKTGVSIMLLDEKMDHGPLLAQQEFSIYNYQFSKGKGKPTHNELHDKLAQLGAELLIKTIPEHTENKIKPKEQEHAEATYTKIIKREDGQIDWTKSAEYIERQFRTFTPWPGIYTYFKGKRIKLLEIYIAPDTTGLSDSPVVSGRVVKYKKAFAIQTVKGFIVPKKLQLEGKKPQTAEEFLHGYSKIIGETLT